MIRVLSQEVAAAHTYAQRFITSPENEENSNTSDNEWIYVIGRLNDILSEDALFPVLSTLVSLGTKWSVEGRK